jgi:hypothetical protein
MYVFLIWTAIEMLLSCWVLSETSYMVRGRQSPYVTQFSRYRRARNRVAPALYATAAISVRDKKDHQVLDATWELSGRENMSFAATETTTSFTSVQIRNSLEYTYFSNAFQVKPTQLGPIDRASPYLRG